jgi:hypothetical protein
MIVVQKRSGKRHLIHPDGLATRCGRIIRKTNFVTREGCDCDCDSCWSNLAADIRKEVRAA